MKVSPKAFSHATKENKSLSAQTQNIQNSNDGLKKISRLKTPFEYSKTTFNSSASAIEKKSINKLTSINNDAGQVFVLANNRNKYLLKNSSHLFELHLRPTLDRVSTTLVPTSAPPIPTYSPPSQTWFFSFPARELKNNKDRIHLTAIESLIIKTLTLSTERICSKHELILGINKDPQVYSGLEMCLSRLQNKFRNTFGERLFRSVRNRGYCLVQDVKNTY